MTKPASSLDLIQIASPCPVAWEDMAGDGLISTDRRRFCGACKLHVYNLSDMSRQEAEAFVAKAEGRTCIRMFRRADGTVLTRDCPVGLRALRQRLVRSLAALVGMVVALLSGTVVARLKISALENLKRPSQAYAEWIEPGSTQMTLGAMVCPPPIMGKVALPPVVLPEGDVALDAPESPLPEPTPEQLEQIAERLK
jgi:hypothetical protein